jgi:hypothetical protein
MAKFAHADVLDNGIAYIKTNCTKMAVVASYTFGDSYATVTGGSNILAEATMTSTDFTLATATNDRTLTTAAGKSDSSANNTGTASHIVFLDVSNTKVLWVTEETSGQTITSGNVVNFPQLVYTTKQPTA